MTGSDKKALGLTLVSGTLGFFLNGTLWAIFTLAFGVVLILSGHFQEIKERKDSVKIFDLYGKPISVSRNPKPWMLRTVLVVMTLMVLVGVLWKWRPHNTAVKESTELNPIGRLSELGWSVQRDEQTGGIQFRIDYKPLPSIQQSVQSFRSLNRPFTLVILGAKTIDGLELLDRIPNFRTLELNAGEFRDISGLSHLTSLTKLVLSQDTNISDISSLSALTNLSDLGLSGAVTDLTPLENLKGITGLGLETPGLHDLSPIRGLKLSKIAWHSQYQHSRLVTTR
jgi:Leucine-rich repeat (LRR) protein